ncbi:MAG: hypothetical protein WDO73_12155 [Ignavibacteriota bacterium]
MALDTEFLRRHYAQMSDEELESIDRNDLVDAARQIFDEEVASRVAAEPEPEAARRAIPVEAVSVEEDWLDDAAEAFSTYARPGTTDPSEGAVDARDALEAAEIPCELELFEEPEAEPQYRYRWRILVPGKLMHRATSVLDRDIFNAQFEAEFRAHLEMLSDEELGVMEPEYAFCGLYDRLDRINRAYSEELERRQLGQ